MTRPSHFDPWWHNWPLALAVAVGLALGIVGLAHAGTVALVWDPVSDPALAGYKLHYGNASKSYTSHIDVGIATSKELTLPAGVYYFAATAYANLPGLESDYSNEAEYTMRLPAPGNNRVQSATITLNFDRGVKVAIK